MADSTTDVFTNDEQLQILALKSNIRSKVGYLKKLIPAIHYDDMFLCGGAIASIIQGKFPNDWDVYFTIIEQKTTQHEVIGSFPAHNVGVRVRLSLLRFPPFFQGFLLICAD